MAIRIVHNLRSGTVKNVRITHKATVAQRVRQKGTGVTAVRAKSKGSGTTAVRVTHKADSGVIA